MDTMLLKFDCDAMGSTAFLNFIVALYKQSKHLFKHKHRRVKKNFFFQKLVISKRSKQ